MLFDTVLGDDPSAVFTLVLLGGCPGEVVTTHLRNKQLADAGRGGWEISSTYLDVVIGKLAVLVVVQTE